MEHDIDKLVNSPIDRLIATLVATLRQKESVVAKLIQRHLPNLLTYLQHRLTDASLEAVSATIRWVKKAARGFRNMEHFKTAIYFYCGGLDLYTHESR